ncbi:S9 family peptidase [Pseudonocardia petroleophila]|uniref:S9 family peptidase n=1 Tax=Pseudonocardia petroleophila TaxID=37331 RepID=A0A7G7ME10_9PSEU|nr:prolyl oligopeptidase family serine peptidase [Pseudonocardia petroleophila]QNG51021.1 S9 family peptidase [Pseudonocardia petroleophila]
MTSRFDDVQRYLDLPRLSGLALSPDGTRLVTSVATPGPDRTRFGTALWEIDPSGERPARRLTRSAKGEAGAVFTPDGDVLFTSARPDPDAAEQAPDSPAALWRLPAGGGEAEVVGTRPGGIGGVAVARDAGTVVVTSMTLPTSTSGEDDEARRKARREKKVTGILHAAHPVRFWDHDLGPDAPRLLCAPAVGDPWTDLTPVPGAALVEGSHDVTPDGRHVVSSWAVPQRGGGTRSTLVVVDTATGERRVLADDPGHEFHGPVISPDGTLVACVRESLSTPHVPTDLRLVVLPLAGGEPVDAAPGWDRWATGAQWTPDGAALVVTADDGGRSPVFRVEDGRVTRLTGDDGAYTDVRVSPDGTVVYALRSAIDAPPAPVRLDATTPDQRPVPLPAPEPAPDVPGTLTEVHATAQDGTPLRAWLVLPDSTEPAPLVLWIHGGPLGSWNAWQWRWNPWLMAAHGYAVLLPDPALSTGYGLDFVARGWGEWGGAPYTDLMALTDAAVARPDVDGTRTAAMGGSFGGYMANWIAGHTDRFAAIVTHASLWALDQFGPTTDAPWYWRREMTAETALANSPHLHADAITTPVLVIHGDRDYRVPVGEALRLWWDLVSRHDGDPDELPHRFLYFPDENHWILTPQNAAVWYATVLAFLDHHVLGKDWATPDLLQ